MALLKGFINFTLFSCGFSALLFAVFASQTDYNRMFTFKESILGKVLLGHVIRNETVPNEGTCRIKCYLEPNCVSINFGPPENGKHKCALNNATDESPGNHALKKKAGYIHYAVENVCHRGPCNKNNSLCQVGFTGKGFRCVCHEGYTGEHCNQDVDECATSNANNCSSNAQCINKPGSFECNCKHGFSGDGVNCSDVDECAGNNHSCHATTNCTNTNGSFQCKCKTGFAGNGSSCLPCTPGTGILSGYCYASFSNPLDWINAEANCRTLGAELLKIESVDENDFIKTNFLTLAGQSGKTYWIGLSDLEAEGAWKWTDGSLLAESDYVNWAHHNPNGGRSQNCGEIVMGKFSKQYFDTEWNDFRCFIKQSFICKFSV